MKTILILIIGILLTPFGANAQEQSDTHKFTNWLKYYIPAEHPGATVDDHDHWYQATIPGHDLTVSWAFLPEEKLNLKSVEGLYKNKPLFISGPRNPDWESANLAYVGDAGYFIDGYDPSEMGALNVAKRSVVQFDGDADKFVALMSSAWEFVPQVDKKLRVMMTTDFPPIGVTKSGNLLPIKKVILTICNQ